MPSEIMDQRRGLSFFSDELRLSNERQIGFWKQESGSDHRGMDGMPLLIESKSVSSSPMEKLRPVGPSSVGRPEHSQQSLVNNQKTQFGLDHYLVGVGNGTSPSVTSWSMKPSSLFLGGNKHNMNGTHYENSLFSSSLSDLLDRKLKLPLTITSLGQSVHTVNPNFEEEEPLESLEELEAQTIGNLLPDDDDLLAGVIDDIGYISRNNFGDDIDDDIFCSGGGMELEGEENYIKGSDLLNGGVHPYGEHPSRTLFVRNINSNVEDTELRMVFEQYGDIRSLYTACKHRGFVMISYYDIRAAQNAMHSLQNKPLRRRKLDIHFSVPKVNPSDKDINQGTLVIYNLDSSVSTDDLHQIFGAYGEIKEIRETPNKHLERFIEFYDVRDAEAALRALNKSDIAGKKIKLEAGHLRGGRRLISPKFELGSSPNSSPPGCNVSPGSVTLGTIPSGFEKRTVQSQQSAPRAPINPLFDSTFHGISSVNHSHPSGHSDSSHSFGQMQLGFEGMPVMHQSIPEYHDGLASGISYNSSPTMPAMAININPRPAEGIDRRFIQRVGSGSLTNRPFEHNEGAYGGPGNGSCPVHGHQYIWNNANAYPHGPHHSAGPIIWGNSPSFMNNIASHHTHQMHGFQRPPSHLMNSVLPLHPHHVGSAPTINPSIWERRQPFVGDSVGRMGFSVSPLDLAPHNIFPHSGGNVIDHVGLNSPQQRSNFFQGRSHGIPMPASFEVSSDRVRSRRGDSNSNQADNKKQYELDIERIVRGEDSRTTLMIKNIPNKYTSKMLLAAIDENHKGTYDFIYLPIDFKNKCNVGYAFINMIEPQQIISFFQAFNGKKWEKFNSEKVASLAYARIQGKAALIAHFQNSSLMNEDKRCRPILFHSDGPNAGDQEPFPMGTNIRSRPGRARTFSNEESNQASPSTSPTGVDFLGSAKDSE